jgi:hypothetical protein
MAIAREVCARMRGFGDFGRGVRRTEGLVRMDILQNINVVEQRVYMCPVIMGQNGQNAANCLEGLRYRIQYLMIFCLPNATKLARRTTQPAQKAGGPVMPAERADRRARRRAAMAPFNEVPVGAAREFGTEPNGRSPPLRGCGHGAPPGKLASS